MVAWGVYFTSLLPCQLLLSPLYASNKVNGKEPVPSRHQAIRKEEAQVATGKTPDGRQHQLRPAALLHFQSLISEHDLQYAKKDLENGRRPPPYRRQDGGESKSEEPWMPGPGHIEHNSDARMQQARLVGLGGAVGSPVGGRVWMVVVRARLGYRGRGLDGSGAQRRAGWARRDGGGAGVAGGKGHDRVGEAMGRPRMFVEEEEAVGGLIAGEIGEEDDDDVGQGELRVYVP